MKYFYLNLRKKYFIKGKVNFTDCSGYFKLKSKLKQRYG